MSNPINHQDHAPELEAQLDAAIWAVLSEPIDADAVTRVKARAAAICFQQSPDVAIPQTDPQSPSGTPAVPNFEPTNSTPLRSSFFSGSLMMKLFSTVAGVVLIVGATLMFHTTPSAFGEAIQQLRAAKSFIYVSRIYLEGNPKPIESKVMVAEDGRRRSELAGETISIMDSASRIRLTLSKGSKRALVSDSGESSTTGPKNDQLAWLENLKSHDDKPDEQLGKKVLDGRNVEGFIAKQDRLAYTVWIDSKTRELVQVEHEMPVEGSGISKVVMTGFRFNEPLDESLFSFDVPEGFVAQKQAAIPKVPGGEKSIVEALRGFTKRSGGKFPKSVTEWGEWAVLISTGSKDGKLSTEDTEIMAHLGSIMPFLVTRSKNDYRYLGAGTSLNDKRSIVFWYRNEDKKLRAIYNDLSVTDVEEKDLPKN